MKILFLHSGFQWTGAITYARALESVWRGRHEVFWTGDTPFSALNRYLQLPLSEKLLPKGIQNAFRLARYIRKQGIQLLHAHSRRANCVAALASGLTGVPYVTTSHQRMKPHAWNRMLGCWGGKTIAICESISTHLRQHNRVPDQQIISIPNGIDLDEFQPAAFEPSRPFIVSVLGRLSGHRWRAAAFILSICPDLLVLSPDVHIHFAGAVDDAYKELLQRLIHQANQGFSRERVRYTGFASDVRPIIGESSVVIAAGRSLLESLAMGVPAIAVGEECDHGLMTPASYSEARATNFGDFSLVRAPYNAARIIDGVRAIVNHTIAIDSLRSWGRHAVQQDYDVRRVASAIEQVYAELLPVPSQAALRKI